MRFCVVCCLLARASTIVDVHRSLRRDRFGVFSYRIFNSINSVHESHPFVNIGSKEDKTSDKSSKGIFDLSRRCFGGL